MPKRPPEEGEATLKSETCVVGGVHEEPKEVWVPNPAAGGLAPKEKPVAAGAGCPNENPEEAGAVVVPKPPNMFGCLRTRTRGRFFFFPLF